MKSEIVISNLKKFEKKKKEFIEGRLDKIHILADFDGTLTRSSLPLMKYLRDGNYLDSDYVQKLTELYEKYHPIEISDKISYKKKTNLMKNWWKEVFNSMIESGLNKKTLERFVNEVNVEFKEGVTEFLKFLNAKRIPLVIISSSGLGSVIPLYFKKEGLMYDNISVVTNLFEFNKQGRITKVKEPIIHVLNKSEVSLKNLPIYNELLNRKNVMLLGDSVGDLGMVEGFDYDNLISIGFLNENIEGNLKNYKKNFDVVITNDGDFDWINDFLKGIK